jgi:SWI/SNF-related matrix-associated actin-dependent regulator of chromatin subfamily A member 5
LTSATDDRTDWERQIAKIETAEAKRGVNTQINQLLTEKVAAASHPYQQLAIPYTSQTKGKSYTEEEDRFLLIHLERHKLGVEGVYELIKKDIVEWPSFRFDWCVCARQ